MEATTAAGTHDGLMAQLAQWQSPATTSSSLSRSIMAAGTESLSPSMAAASPMPTHLQIQALASRPFAPSSLSSSFTPAEPSHGNQTQTASAQPPFMQGSQPPAEGRNAERRATHNAVERARRESLNVRFTELASVVPTLSGSRKPSKSMIIQRSLEYVIELRQRMEIKDRSLAALRQQNSDLREELARLRSALGMPQLSIPEIPDDDLRFEAFLRQEHEKHLRKTRRSQKVAQPPASQSPGQPHGGTEHSAGQDAVMNAFGSSAIPAVTAIAGSAQMNSPSSVPMHNLYISSSAPQHPPMHNQHALPPRKASGQSIDAFQAGDDDDDEEDDETSLYMSSSVRSASFAVKQDIASSLDSTIFDPSVANASIGSAPLRSANFASPVSMSMPVAGGAQPSMNGIAGLVSNQQFNFNALTHDPQSLSFNRPFRPSALSNEHAIYATGTNRAQHSPALSGIATSPLAMNMQASMGAAPSMHVASGIDLTNTQFGSFQSNNFNPSVAAMAAAAIAAAAAASAGQSNSGSAKSGTNTPQPTTTFVHTTPTHGSVPSIHTPPLSGGPAAASAQANRTADFARQQAWVNSGVNQHFHTAQAYPNGMINNGAFFYDNSMPQYRRGNVEESMLTQLLHSNSDMSMSQQRSQSLAPTDPSLQDMQH